MYTLLKFEKESTLIEGKMKDIYVALIRRSEVSQPFRVTVENFTDENEAMKEVEEWIACREAEDAAALAERQDIEQREKKDRVLNNLNRSIEE